MQSRVILSATLAALIGCGSGSDSPTGAHRDAASPLRVIVVGGGSQQAFPGDELGAPLVVQVIDSAAHPVMGKRRVRFSVVSGAGSVSDTLVLTAEDGSASVTWRLGAAVGTQQIAAALADVANSQTIALATAVSPDAADLVIVRGATSGDVHVLLNQDDAYTRYRLTWPDTVIRLLPRGQIGNWQEVTAFSAEHPPETVLQPWTAGIDTVRLILRAPIVVPFTMWVTHDFDTNSVRARYDAAQVDKFWRSHMTGLRVGAVRIENLAAYQGKIAQCADVPSGRDTTAINVYYLANQTPGGPSYQCSASTVLVGPNFYAFDPMYQWYLAHDVGHAFGLEHVSDAANLMSISWPPGGGLTTGQIYRMHFQNSGTANVVLRAHTVGVRNCYSTITHCPAQTFVGW